MENIVFSQIEKSFESNSLLLTSLIVQDVHDVQKDIHVIVAAILRYAEIGASVTNTLLEWSLPAAAEN